MKHMFSECRMNAPIKWSVRPKDTCVIL